MAVVFIGGSMLVLGPLPRRSRELLGDFAGRYQGTRDLGLVIRPLHGALLLARLAIIVPVWIAAGLIIGEADFHLGSHLMGVMSRFIASTLLLGCLCGALAIWLYKRKLRWPFVTWLALWIAPEVIRLIAPGSPTFRTVFVWLFSTQLGNWGQS
jgi:hypothetical protein